MELELINLGRNQSDWDFINLSLAGDNLGLDCKYSILETDQVGFRLKVPSNFVSAKLIVEKMEVGGVVSLVDDVSKVFEWLPRRNKVFGYESLFLHFFGVAQLAIELIDLDDEKKVYLFESISVYGRKVTAERAEAMLSYISSKADKYLLEALSPTSFSANLVSNGIAPAEILKRLEKSLSDIEPTLKNVIVNPISSLRPKFEVVYNPIAEEIDDKGIEWICENVGLSEDATCEDDGLFKFGMHWKLMPEVVKSSFEQSTDLYENQIVVFYLNRMLMESKGILLGFEKVKINISSSEGKVIHKDYVSFYSVAKKGLQADNIKNIRRAKSCIEKVERMLNIFNKMVPTTKLVVGKIYITEKLKSNRHYLLLLKYLKEWTDVRDINWVEKSVLNNIHSTPVLFEYYTVLLTDSWLKSNGIHSKDGLFDGDIHGRKVRLYYEPTYPSSKNEKSIYNIWSSDINVTLGRRPDIVVDVDYDIQSERELYIFDAKCRSEHKVLKESIPDCIPKYGYGIRDAIGRNPVKCIVMLHPKPSSVDDLFIDFYSSPYHLDGKFRAYPVIGAQRINLSHNGVEFGFQKLLTSLLTTSVAA